MEIAIGHRLYQRGQRDRLCLCGRASYARGWCRPHYERWRKDGGIRLCSIAGCDRGYESQGFCRLHYDRFNQHGDPLMVLSNRYPKGSSPTTLAESLGVSRQRGDQILHPEKHRARKVASAALKDGSLHKPQACERCDKRTPALAAHHADYSKPLDVDWLCRPCHVIVHPHGRQPGSRNGGPP